MFEFHAALVVPDASRDSLSFADRVTDHKHYLVIERSEESADAALFDVNNVYIERDDQQFGGYGGIESVTLSRSRLTLKLTTKMAVRMGHQDELSVTFAADDALFRQIDHLVSAIFRGYESRVLRVS